MRGSSRRARTAVLMSVPALIALAFGALTVSSSMASSTGAHTAKASPFTIVEIIVRAGR